MSSDVISLNMAEQAKLRPAAQAMAVAVASRREDLIMATREMMEGIARPIAEGHGVPAGAVLMPIELDPDGEVQMRYEVPKT